MIASLPGRAESRRATLVHMASLKPHNWETSGLRTAVTQVFSAAGPVFLAEASSVNLRRAFGFGGTKPQCLFSKRRGGTNCIPTDGTTVGKLHERNSVEFSSPQVPLAVGVPLP